MWLKHFLNCLFNPNVQRWSLKHVFNNNLAPATQYVSNFTCHLFLLIYTSVYSQYEQAPLTIQLEV